MAHLERYLEGETACEGPGIYPVKAYVSLHGTRRLRPVLVRLGRHSFQIESVADITEEVRRVLGSEIKGGRKLALEELAAFCVMKECERKTHISGPPTLGQVRLERRLSVAVARDRNEVFEIMPPVVKYPSATLADGIGQLRFTEAGTTPVPNGLFLPATPREDATLPMQYAIRTIVRGPTLSHDPYVPLHGSPVLPGLKTNPLDSVEQIVTPDDFS
jgi:hypothetical protein